MSAPPSTAAQTAFVAWILRAEGGYVDDPDDPGGATRYGISLRYLRGKGGLGDIDGDGVVDADDIRALTEQDAIRFFLDDFWSPCRCDELPDPIAIALADGAVNMGVRRAVMLLQETVHATIDGVIGPQTIGAVHRRGAEGLLPLCLARRARHYHDLVRANSGLAKFLDGWFNRLFLLHAYLLEGL